MKLRALGLMGAGLLILLTLLFAERAQRAQRDAENLRAVLEADRAAKAALQVQVDLAEADAASLQEQIEAFRNETTVHPDCVVDGNVLERLRSR